MKKIFAFAAILFLNTAVRSQDATVKDLKKDAQKEIKKDAADTAQQVWKKGGLFNLNINQGSLSNWSAGGDKFSFSLNAYLNLYAFYKRNKNSWDNTLDLAYGMVNTTSLGSRKSSDRIDYTSRYGYAIAKKTDLSVLFNTRTQFAKGYAYTKTAAGLDSASLTSKTFMPAYVLLSIGFDYKPTSSFSIFASPVTARWVIVGDDLLAPLYGVPAGKNARQEFGAFVSANYMKKFGEKFTYKSKLDLFSNYKSKPQNIDIYCSNVVAAKITKHIDFSFNLDMIYDDDTQNVDPTKGPALQILELMGIGIAYNFKNKKP